MLCKQCGSTQFEEENGLFYCCFCQTQSQGFTQESAGDYVNVSRLQRTQVTKKRVKRVVQQKTGVLWTTTEAFNLILLKQMNTISKINKEIIDSKEMHELTLLIWSTYLRLSGLAFTDGESSDTEVITRRLHPASRFRDVQILTNRVENCLPPYKNGSTELGFCQLFSLGSDGVVRTFDESETISEFDAKLTEEQNSFEFFDIFYERYRDPRKYLKLRPKPMKISKESRKQLREVLSKMSSHDSSEEGENFDNFDEENVNLEENVLKAEHSIDQDLRDSPKSKASITSFDSIETNSLDEDYDKELMKNLTETTKLFGQYIPLSHMKNSSNINSNYFIDLMSLPKTLSILNMVLRLLCCDIYCFDLIRWANEGHIPYNNCLTCLPEDWLLIANDFHTFTSSCVPSSKTISILSAKIANFIEIKSFPRPKLEKLLIRFAKDLNLPKDLVHIINSHYGLFKYFPKELGRMTKCSSANQMPYYEMWALMAIILVLKRIFFLNDSSEKLLSQVENQNYLFIWDEWESYTRARVELIRSYFIPSYVGDLEDIRDVDLIAEHFLQRSETLPSFGLNKNATFKHSDFRNEAQKEFKQLLFDTTECQSSPLEPSLYPLTNATNFALNRINSSSSRDKMSISFEEKLMVPWVCNHGKVFHRGYEFLNNDPNKWSDSFKLLIYLSCFLLNCRTETLIPVLKCMENRYFGKNSD